MGLKRKSKIRLRMLLLLLLIASATGIALLVNRLGLPPLVKYQDLVATLASIISSVAAAIGVVAIWYQLKKDNEISRADFILSLNKSFSENGEIRSLYNKLKQYRDMGDVEFDDLDLIRLGDYLTFFEVVEYMLSRDTVTMEMVDELFAGRFFIMAHNPFMQRYFARYPQFTRSIFKLHFRWTQYRTAHELAVPYPDHPLEKTVDNYSELVSEEGLRLKTTPNPERKAVSPEENVDVE